MKGFIYNNSGRLMAPIAVMVVMAMLFVPFTPLMLDMMFTVNIALTLTVLFVVISSEKPLDFSLFPKVILFAAVLRLGLNVASTRVILINGHEGSGGAGKIIEAFGQFVVGGNFAVGIIIFFILTMISIMVIVKGAERISEVKARFSLDSLPGNQMSIDADLNAGAITQEEAASRRKEVGMESQFYGSMDGASKFVKGDAYIGILILAVNILGGLVIGMVQHGMSFSASITNYTLLSIGDGLVAQVPSLIMATATAIMIAGVSGKERSEGGISEISRDKAVLYSVSGILLIIGFIPGMPLIVFILLSSGFALWGYMSKSQAEAVPEDDSEVFHAAPSFTLTEKDIKIPSVIEIRLGMRLLDLVQEESSFMSQVAAMRKELSSMMGFLVKGVSVKESSEIDRNGYEILINGTNVASGSLWTSLKFAVDVNGSSNGAVIHGKEATDPVFGGKGYWIRESDAAKAREKGFHVTNAQTILATHLREVTLESAHKIIKTEDVTACVDRVKSVSPELANLVTSRLDHITILKVFRQLLMENVAIRDIETIFETLAANSRSEVGYRHLAEMCRRALSEMITRDLSNSEGKIEAMVLVKDDQLEATKYLKNGSLNMPPELSSRIFTRLQKGIDEFRSRSLDCVLLVPNELRAGLSDSFIQNIPDLSIICPAELTASVQISTTTLD